MLDALKMSMQVRCSRFELRTQWAPGKATHLLPALVNATLTTWSDISGMQGHCHRNEHLNLYYCAHFGCLAS